MPICSGAKIEQSCEEMRFRCGHFCHMEERNRHVAQAPKPTTNAVTATAIEFNKHPKDNNLKRSPMKFSMLSALLNVCRYLTSASEVFQRALLSLAKEIPRYQNSVFLSLQSSKRRPNGTL